MRSLTKIIRLINTLILFQLLSSLSGQTISTSDYWNFSSLGPTPLVSNMSSTEKEVSANTQPQSIDRNSNIAMYGNDDEIMAMKYLYTNDDSLLTSSSCLQPFQLARPRGAVPPDLQAMLSHVTLSLTKTANFLNLIFQASELRETSVQEDIEWYHALVRSMLVSEKPSLIKYSRLRFNADPNASGPQLVLQASRTQSQDIYLQDLTSSWKNFQFLVNGSDPNWFIKSSSPPILGLSKQVLVNDLSSLDTPKWAHGGTHVTNSSGLQWGMAPFLECKEGRFLPEWLLTLSMPFYGLKPDLSPEFRGVIQVDVNIQGFDINQCNTEDTWFAGTHKCNQTSMKCEQIPGQGFWFGQYCCRCKEGYYSLSSDTDDKNNSMRMCYPEMPVCLPCWPGCMQCKNGLPCRVEEDWVLRAALLAVQGFLMALVLLIMLVMYKFCRARRIQASAVLLLEIILFGSVLLYFPVFILSFEPSLFRCILLRWVRLLGFTIVYGTVTLKMYRLLNVFLSCTAQRVPYMSNASLLRILGVMVLITKWFLCAWTAGVLQNRDCNLPLLFISTTLDGQSFNMCDSDWWDYLMALAELLFLCWGILLCHAVKSVPSAFHEPQYMSIAIHNELFFSAIFHLVRFTQTSVHPDWMLSLFFVHTHATITVTLGLLFVPKCLYMSRPVKEDVVSEMYEDEVDLHHTYIHLNSNFTSSYWSDNSLDPDDIRDELKNLYARLETQKSKKIANNNPHLQKKRSSRLMFGRSLIKHIAEIPESMTRQCSHKHVNISRTKETTLSSASYKGSSESICVTMRNEEAKLPSAVIKTVQNTCKNIPEMDILLINSSDQNCTERRSSNSQSIKTTPVKRASVAESNDTAPFFCRSASAHNLVVDNNVLQPLPTSIQKSYSFSGVLLAHTNGTKDTSHTPEINPDTSALAQDSIQNATVNAVEEQPTVTNINQKQAINSQQEPPAHRIFSSPSLLYVCPWEFPSSLPPQRHVGEHSMVSDIESQRSQVPVSCSAPASPHGIGRPVSHHMFSFQSAAQSLLLAGRLVPRKGTGKCSVRTPQILRRALTCDESKPCLKKQGAIRLSSNDSTESNSRSNASPSIPLWKSEDITTEVKRPNLFGVQRQIIYKQSLSLTSSTESNQSTGHQIRSSLTVSKPDLCPWDVANQTQPENIQSQIADTPPCKFNNPEKIQPEDINKHVSHWKSNSKQTQMTADLADICPWEVPEETSIKNYLTQDEGYRETNVCPSNVPVCSTLQIKPDSVQIPFTTRPSERIIHVDFHAVDKKLNRLVKQETLRSDICPWETTETTKDQNSGNMADQEMKVVTDLQDSASRTTLYSTIQAHSIGDICPWDLPESPKSNSQDIQDPKNDCITVVKGKSENLSNISTEDLRFDVKINKTMHILPKQSTSTADICPWDFPELPPIVVDDCSLMSGEPNSKLIQETEEYSTQEITQKKTDICPWESDKPESLQETSTATAIQKPENAYTDICPWTTEIYSDSTQSNAKYDMCPWEQENTEKSQIQENMQARYERLEDTKISVSDTSKKDTCAYDVQGGRANRPLTRCDALCPWEIKSPSITEHLDVFTWEEPIPEEGDAETAAEAFIFPPVS